MGFIGLDLNSSVATDELQQAGNAIRLPAFEVLQQSEFLQVPIFWT